MFSRVRFSHQLMNTSVKMMNRGITLLLAGYWLAIFVATHVPHVPAALALFADVMP